MDKIRILIAEGTASVRQFIRYALEDHFKGAEFEIATNGKNIQKRLESALFDLILYDRDMPFLGGDELLKWLKGHDKLKDVPFIMISGDRDEDSLKKAVRLGADAYLIKPLLIGPLVDKVREMLKKSERNKVDWRKSERTNTGGSVLLKYDSQTSSGRLLNISPDSLLASFDRNGPLPRILVKTDIRIDTDSNRRIEGFHGHVVRIQVDSFADAKEIQVAVQFAEETVPDVKKMLAEFISSLKHQPA
jgi:DNA-binding response OmpR family regulator